MKREDRKNDADAIVPLINDDNPTWLVHSDWGPDVDVVAVPLPSEKPSRRTPAINSLPETPLVTRIAERLFILGYPFRDRGLPIWKQATLASEPDLARNGPHHMIVDTLSRPGMSGSPVIHRAMIRGEVETSPILPDDPGEGMYTNIQDFRFPVTRFIGVYSGRLLTRSADDAQLGIVWPRHHLEEIVQ